MEVVFILILGCVLGSFLNVCIDRLPSRKTLLGRSKCDYCRKKLNPIDLIPVISYFFLKGKCRFCKKKISFYYPLIELLTGILFVTSWVYLSGPLLLKISYLGVIASLVVIFFADLKYHIIPDEATVATALFSLPGVFMYWPMLTTPFESSIVAGVVLTLTLFIIHIITKGNGMGLGDVKFAFVIGLLLGLRNGFLALYIAFFLGGIVGLLLILAKRKKAKSHIAFGPFLVTGVFTMLFFGNEINLLVDVIF